MIHRILVNPGTPQAWDIALRPGVNRIGSSQENDFVIDHPSISAQHCEVLVGDTGVRLKDLGSETGTFAGGVPVGELWLQSGQHIQIGAVATMFESRQPTPSAPSVSQPAPGATVFVAGFGSSSAARPAECEPIEPRAAGLDSPGKSLSCGSAESTDRPKKFPVHQAAEREALRRKQFILGTGGTITGCLLGVFVWALLTKVTGTPLLVMAWGVGGAAGFGAHFLAKGGGLPLGIAAATCALAGIIGGDVMAAKLIRTKQANRQAVTAYRSQLEFAKESVRADSPEKIRNLLSQLNQKAPGEITDDQVRSFQTEEQPRFRDFALGKPSKAEFVSEAENKFTQEFDYKEYFLKEDVKSGLFILLFAALAIVTAYKIGSGKPNED